MSIKAALKCPGVMTVTRKHVRSVKMVKLEISASVLILCRFNQDGEVPSCINYSDQASSINHKVINYIFYLSL